MKHFPVFKKFQNIHSLQNNTIIITLSFSLLFPTKNTKIKSMVSTSVIFEKLKNTCEFKRLKEKESIVNTYKVVGPSFMTCDC